MELCTFTDPKKTSCLSNVSIKIISNSCGILFYLAEDVKTYLSSSFLLPIKSTLLFTLFTGLRWAIFFFWICTTLTLGTNKRCNYVTILTGFGLKKQIHISIRHLKILKICCINQTQFSDVFLRVRKLLSKKLISCLDCYI